MTILPRTNGAGGFTLFTPPEERLETGMYSKRYLKSQLVVALGGRVSEELVFGAEEVTTGASNDLQQVRDRSRRTIYPVPSAAHAVSALSRGRGCWPGGPYVAGAQHRAAYGDAVGLL